MDHRAQRNKSRASYFGNVKNRLGSKLPAGISQPPGFITAQCSIGTQVALGKSVGQECVKGHHQIRNPKLRQYYLKEAAFPAKDPTTKTLESCGNNEHGLPKNKASTSTETASDLRSRQEHSLDPALDVGVVGTATLVSPSTDAEYDKLTDVEAVPLPDGNVCLLALPSECSQGEGPAGLSCLKLFSRYITDRKGVVAGILLVTSNKIFFDPQKSQPLVQENGCEEYVFSCSVDDLTSVSFYTDISHIHFNKTYRCNSCKPSKSKKEHKKTHQSVLEAVLAPKSSVSHDPTPTPAANPEEEDEEGGEAGDMAETERQLTLESEQSYLERQLLGTCAATSSSGVNGSLMFVRIRQKLQHAKKKAFSKPKIPSRDAWFTMQQERSDELHAYLSQHRPDLCILEGGEGDEADEEDFVLLDEEEQEEQEEEEGSPREGQAGEDWEVSHLLNMVSVEESAPKASVSTEPEGLSHILNQSVILDAQQVREISKELPPRTVGHTWQLSYSTDKHGASLKTLYRKLSTTDSPVLILIKDHNQQVFGSFLSHPLHPSEAFYGTGETFLFLSHPRFKCFRWTGENSFFIKGDLDSFAIGGGSGHFGLWVDERLFLGRSSPCFTFNNCSLSETNDFTILELEAWTFG
ncbi:oxidation resistance protein 1 isoform X1 [Cyprinus carpio]|uniref:Oxidation resistance protein 1 isoform X1 n=2 Tax=Cyprinus carpio TaxID=7962 RepID=A0A9Q9XAT4_CYPCA|nr:oxidation resistance protein 1 isoform X1 [Cyprinus carpio]XP_042598221.1 oxidation resistance protein 1 isoform X1 [Cyprinus carpio]XP_042598222.1 oxidation resistance protein 1 isoform X1 [Cyprinus carpio]